MGCGFGSEPTWGIEKVGEMKLGTGTGVWGTGCGKVRESQFPTSPSPTYPLLEAALSGQRFAPVISVAAFGREKAHYHLQLAKRFLFFVILEIKPRAFALKYSLTPFTFVILRQALVKWPRLGLNAILPQPPG